MALYFDNKAAQELIKQYKAELDPVKKKNLRDEIMLRVKDIVNGIIFTHEFTAFEPYDDLLQEALLASMVALERFDPEKGTAFNYFSLVAKKSLTYYTLKNKKNRNNPTLEFEGNFLAVKKTITDFDIEILVRQLRIYFQEPKLKKLQPLNDILEKYLKTKRRFNRRDFFRYCRSFGYSSNIIRKYLKIIYDNKDEVYEIYEF